MPAPPENAAETLALIRARAEAAAALREDCDDLLNNPLAVFTVGYTKRGSECR